MQKNNSDFERKAAIRQVLKDHHDASSLFRELLSLRKSAVAAADSFDEFVKKGAG